MNKSGISRIAYVTLLALFCPGCLACYTTRTVDVVVTERKSGLPLADSAINVGYNAKIYVPLLNKPSGDSGKTDRNGAVALRIADFDWGQIVLYGGEQRDGRSSLETLLEPRIIHEGGVLDTEGYLVRLTPRPRWPTIANCIEYVRMAVNPDHDKASAMAK